jgi:hypothetical protein
MNENIQTRRTSLVRWNRSVGSYSASVRISRLQPKSPIECQLLYRSTSEHLQQLYTGFLLLHESGFIRLSQRLRHAPVEYANAPPHLKDAGHAHLDVVLEGNVRLHFDTHDAEEIATDELETCDFYFKRSYAPDVVAALPPNQRKRVFPLGLNYRVLPDRVDPFAIRRGIRLTGISRTSALAVKQACDIRNYLGYQPRLALMHSAIDFAAEPRVLFLAAAYDPYDDPRRDAQKIQDRINVNENRARIIRLMKGTLGVRFTGGFADSKFCRDQYPDLLVAPEVTHQQQYLLRLKTMPICIATSGLHGSIGWKFAEYVAFARAPVSEALTYSVPGPFAPDRNYLPFTSPAQCLNAAIKLIEDRSLRQELMRNNAAYYQSHLRPDSLVRNALMLALGRPADSTSVLHDPTPWRQPGSPL